MIIVSFNSCEKKDQVAVPVKKGGVRGIIRNEALQPVSDCSINIGPIELKSSENGTFNIPELNAGNYTIIACRYTGVRANGI